MSKKIMVWVILGCTLLVTGLLVFGLVTKTEPGLKNSEARWPQDKFPLTVEGLSYSKSALTGDDRKAIEGMMDNVNTRLGFKAYQWANGGGVASVTVTIGVPHDDTWSDPGGNYGLYGDSRTKEWEACEIQTSNTGTAEYLSLTLYHEAGHCLGLEHDVQSALSIMRPVQVARPQGSLPPWITDFDRGILRDLYK